jgi:hypothetical protein
MLILLNPMGYRLNSTGSRNGYGTPSAAIKFGAQFAYEKTPLRRYVRELEAVDSDPAVSLRKARAFARVVGVLALTYFICIQRLFECLRSSQIKAIWRLADTH